MVGLKAAATTATITTDDDDDDEQADPFNRAQNQQINKLSKLNEMCTPHRIRINEKGYYSFRCVIEKEISNQICEKKYIFLEI